MSTPANRTKANWRELSKCKSLTTTQSDKLFFTGPGGKSNKAKAFCETCPVQDFCLREAIESRSVGFVAGTTEQERASMAQFLDEVNFFMETGEFLPEIEEPTSKPKKRPKQLRKRVNPLDDPLYGIPDPTEDELKELEQAS